MPNNIKEYIDQDYEIVDMDNFDPLEEEITTTESDESEHTIDDGRNPENQIEVITTSVDTNKVRTVHSTNIKNVKDLDKSLSEFQDTDMLSVSSSYGSGCEEYDPNYHTMSLAEFKSRYSRDCIGNDMDIDILTDINGNISKTIRIQPGYYSGGVGTSFRISILTPEQIKNNELYAELRIKKLEMLKAQINVLDENRTCIIEIVYKNGHIHQVWHFENKNQILESINDTIESAKAGSNYSGDIDYDVCLEEDHFNIITEIDSTWHDRYKQLIEEKLKNINVNRTVYFPVYMDGEKVLSYDIQVTIKEVLHCFKFSDQTHIRDTNGRLHLLSNINFDECTLSNTVENSADTELAKLNGLEENQEILIEYYSNDELSGTEVLTATFLRKKLQEAMENAQRNGGVIVLDLENGDFISTEQYEHHFTFTVLTEEMKTEHKTNQAHLNIIKELEGMGIDTAIFLDSNIDIIQSSDYITKLKITPEEIIRISNIIKIIVEKSKIDSEEIKKIRELIQKS